MGACQAKPIPPGEKAGADKSNTKQLRAEVAARTSPAAPPPRPPIAIRIRILKSNKVTVSVGASEEVGESLTRKCLRNHQKLLHAYHGDEDLPLRMRWGEVGVQDGAVVDVVVDTDKFEQVRLLI